MLSYWKRTKPEDKTIPVSNLYGKKDNPLFRILGRLEKGLHMLSQKFCVKAKSYMGANINFTIPNSS